MASLRPVNTKVENKGQGMISDSKSKNGIHGRGNLPPQAVTGQMMKCLELKSTHSTHSSNPLNVSACVYVIT